MLECRELPPHETDPAIVELSRRSKNADDTMRTGKLDLDVTAPVMVNPNLCQYVSNSVVLGLTRTNLHCDVLKSLKVVVFEKLIGHLN